MKFYRIVDREPIDPRHSSDGGDYQYGRTVAVEDGSPVAVRYWTSADFPYCPLCGRFDSHSVEECFSLGADEGEGDGWEGGVLLTGTEAEVMASWWDVAGKFNPMKRVMLLD